MRLQEKKGFPFMADVAEDHYVFQSAAEGGDPPGGGPDVEHRMAMLEESMLSIQASLNALAGQTGTQTGGVQSEAARSQPAVAVPLPKRPSALRKPKEVNKERHPMSLMDPSVVQSARQAGIPEGQLNALARLLGKTNRMADQPGSSKAAPRGMELSESEDDAEDEDPEEVEAVGSVPAPRADGAPQNPIEKAVVQLTKIVTRMARKPGRDLEALLDGADGGTGEAGLGTSAGKGKAAAYKRLKAALTDNPAYIYETVEGLMETDFMQARTGPGTTNLKPGLGRAQIQDCPFPEFHQGHLGSGCNPRLPESGSLSACCCGLGSVQPGRGLLDHVPGTAVGASSAVCGVPQQTDAGASASKLVDERWLAVLQWKLRGPRQLSRGSEALGAEQSEGGSTSGARGGSKRSSTEERREERRKEGWQGQRSRRGRRPRSRFLRIESVQGPDVGPKAPGSGASTVHGQGIWELLWSSLCRSRTRLRFTWIAARSNPARNRAAFGRVWPMPLPYPEVHRSKGERREDASKVKLGVNYIVLCLNHVQNRGRHWRLSRQWNPAEQRSVGCSCCH